MRVVVDTDVFVSAALKEASWPGRVVRWVDPTGGLPKTEVAEAPVMDVLQRPSFAAKIPARYLDRVRQIFSRAELVPMAERTSACRDPADDRFFELAINGRADTIVTGDRDLLVLNPFRGIPIITPLAFCYVQAMQ